MGGANVINLSSALVQPSLKGESMLEETVNHAARRGVVTVAAAGNQGTVGSSAIIRHLWANPAAACNAQAKPFRETNLGNSIGRRWKGIAGVPQPTSELSSHFRWQEGSGPLRFHA